MAPLLFASGVICFVTTAFVSETGTLPVSRTSSMMWRAAETTLL